jgi:hypothetical protein
VAEIKDVEGKVSMVLPGQQPYALIEKGKDAFSLSPLPETYWLKVVRDATGKIEKVVAVQPDGEVGFKPAGGKPSITVDELSGKVIEAMGGEANWRKLTVASLDIRDRSREPGREGHRHGVRESTEQVGDRNKYDCARKADRHWFRFL